MKNNVYELAICFDKDYDNVETFEYTTLMKMLLSLDYILKEGLYEEADRIELSILERYEENGENENTFTFGEIDMKEWNKGKELNKKRQYAVRRNIGEYVCLDPFEDGYLVGFTHDIKQAYTTYDKKSLESLANMQGCKIVEIFTGR